jgi:hypothetical protein
MADQPTTPSGSRWEPGSDENPAAENPTAEYPTAETPAAYDVPLVAPLDDPAAEERRAQLRGRAILAGAATALALGGGLTGFVIGHSTAGNDTNGFTPANFSGQQPGGGQQFGEGQQGPPSFQDDDGDGFGAPPGSDGSSSGGTTSNSASGT